MSFVENGRPNPDDKEEILDELINIAEQEFGQEFTPDEVSVVRAFYDPVAEYFAEQQQDIAEVLNSAQIDHASGDALDLQAGLIEVTRKQAQPATVRQQFQNDSPVASSKTIPAGTGVQTDDVDPVSFETDVATQIPYLDGFEDGDISEYTGDTGVFSVQTSTVYAGNDALKASASNGSIVTKSDIIERGARFHTRMYVNAGAAAGFLFAADDNSNFYRVTVDEGAGSVTLDVVESNSATTIKSVSNTIPASEWVHLRVDWKHNGDFTVYLENASGTELVNFDANEDPATYDVGGYGFSSEDSSATKFFDEATTSRVSVDATATEDGAKTNVGANVLVIEQDSVPGVDDVTNPIAASGGRDKELDEEFRTRAKDESSESLRATLQGLITRLDQLDAVRTVTVIDNDSDSTDGDGRPPHSFEPVVDTDQEGYDDVAETIVNTKAAGDTSVGGYAGTNVTRTVELTNGQDKDIDFSIPTQITIYIDCDLTKTDVYGGDDAVQDSIVQYIGGKLNSGDNVDGELGVSDDVIYNQVLEAVMDVEGVYDVTNLEVDTSSSPTGTSNITIADTETANADATDGTLDIASSDV